MISGKKEKVDVVVSMTYGATKSALMLPTRQVLDKAIFAACGIENSLLVCLSEDHPKLGVIAKDGWLPRKEVIPFIQRVEMVRVINSISEPVQVKELLDEKGFEPLSFHLFCDRFHAMRVSYIWKHFFPDIPVSVHPTHCTWTKEQPYWSQRGPGRWFLVNVVILLMMKVLGIEKMSTLRQPS